MHANLQRDGEKEEEEEEEDDSNGIWDAAYEMCNTHPDITTNTDLSCVPSRNCKHHFTGSILGAVRF